MAASPKTYGELRLYLKGNLVRDQWKAITQLLPTRPGRAQVEQWTSALNLLDYMQGTRAADGLPLLSETRLERLIELLQHHAVRAADAAQVVRNFAAARVSGSTDHQLPFVSGSSTFQSFAWSFTLTGLFVFSFRFSSFLYCLSTPSKLSD